MENEKVEESFTVGDMVMNLHNGSGPYPWKAHYKPENHRHATSGEALVKEMQAAFKVGDKVLLKPKDQLHNSEWCPTLDSLKNKVVTVARVATKTIRYNFIDIEAPCVQVNDGRMWHGAYCFELASEAGRREFKLDREFKIGDELMLKSKHHPAHYNSEWYPALDSLENKVITVIGIEIQKIRYMGADVVATCIQVREKFGITNISPISDTQWHGAYRFELASGNVCQRGQHEKPFKVDFWGPLKAKVSVLKSSERKNYPYLCHQASLFEHAYESDAFPTAQPCNFKVGDKVIILPEGHPAHATCSVTPNFSLMADKVLTISKIEPSATSIYEQKPHYDYILYFEEEGMSTWYASRFDFAPEWIAHQDGVCDIAKCCWYPTSDFEKVSEWPDCIIPGCKHKSCKRLDSIYCYPHHAAFMSGADNPVRVDKPSGPGIIDSGPTQTNPCLEVPVAMPDHLPRKPEIAKAEIDSDETKRRLAIDVFRHREKGPAGQLHREDGPAMQLNAMTVDKPLKEETTVHRVLEGIVAVEYSRAAKKVARAKAEVEINAEALIPGMMVYHRFKHHPAILLMETQPGFWSIELKDGSTESEVPEAILTPICPNIFLRAWLLLKLTLYNIFYEDVEVTNSPLGNYTVRRFRGKLFATAVFAIMLAAACPLIYAAFYPR